MTTYFVVIQGFDAGALAWGAQSTDGSATAHGHVDLSTLDTTITIFTKVQLSVRTEFNDLLANVVVVGGLP